MKRYKRLLPYVLRRWPALLFIMGLTAMTSAVTALQPWPMKLLVDHAIGDTPVPDTLAFVLEALSVPATPTMLVALAALGSLALFGLNSVLDVGLSWTWTAAGQRMVYDLAADLFHRLQRLSFFFHVRRGIGDSLSRLTGDTWCVYTLANGLLVSPAQHILTIVTLGVVAWHLDPGLTIVSLVTAPVLAGSALYFGDRLKRWTLLNREAESRLMSFVLQTLSAIPVVQAFGTERRNRRHFQRLASEAVVLSQRGTLFNSVYGLVNGLATTLGMAVVLFVGGQRVLSEALSMGSLLVFLGYLRSLHEASQHLLDTYGSLKTVEASMDRVLEVLEARDEVRDRPGARPLPPLPQGRGRHVRVEGVSFGYEPGRPALKGVDLEARPGETIALVGPTGAGKSTLVSLIPRFFDPWQGRVTIDGVDVRDAKLSSVRAQVALVLQEPFLLPLSVAENIAYGRPGASREQVVAAAVAARADDFIRQLPMGYDTVIGEHGATLSGGERKRLSIARALLKDAPILILDEPTSALDARTEASLLEALEALMAGRTTFIVAHRLSTIRGADRIVVIDGGKVVETGTHEELMSAQGIYHRMHTLQFIPHAREVVA